MQLLSAKMKAMRRTRRTRTGTWATGNVIAARCIAISGKALLQIWQVEDSLRCIRRPVLERYALPARYSLVVSIHTEQTEVDLYAVIANKVGILV